MGLFNELWNKLARKMDDKVTLEVTLSDDNKVIESKGTIEDSPALSSHLNEMWEVAQAYGYERYEHQEQNKMISFFKDGVRINVYYTTMTVGTCLKHPSQGKTQLFRRNVSDHELEEILRYPRVHTKKGYKKSKKK